MLDARVKKIAFKLFSVISWVLISALIAVSFSGKKSALKISAETELENETSAHENQETYFYFFTEEQRKSIGEKIRSNEGAALELTVFDDGEKNFFYRTVRFGFIYDSGERHGKGFPLSVNIRPYVSFNFSLMKSSEVKISMCFSKSSDNVKGFYVFGENPFHVENMDIVPAKIGWDISSDVPVLAFGCEGGRADSSFVSADFSSAKKIFSGKNRSGTVMPKVEIKLRSVSDVPSENGMGRLGFKYGDENYIVRRSPSQNVFTIQTSAAKDGFSLMEFTENASLVESVFMTANDIKLCSDEEIVDEPFVSDLGMIILWPKSAWRTKDYELFRWEQFPDVLVFDFASYRIQNRFMTRLAYYVEKDGYRGKFVGDDFIETKKSYNAHDYKADDLADFFTQAEKKKIRLNKEEILLRKILVKNGIIVDGGNGNYLPGKGAVISMSKESWTELRYQLMAHEAWHGIYFIDPDFRKFADSIYEKTSSTAVGFLKSYFSSYESLDYDTKSGYLMRNEFMAYMLQQSPENTGKNFMKISTWSTIAEKKPSQCAYMQKTRCSDFVTASNLLCGYVSERWGYWGGRNYLISKN